MNVVTDSPPELITPSPKLEPSVQVPAAWAVVAWRVAAMSSTGRTTFMILMLSVHASRRGDLVGDDAVATDPPVPLSAYDDMFGNRCTRLMAPALNLGQDLYIGNSLKTGRIMVKDEDVCLHCGLCAERCPTGAWDMTKYLIDITMAGPACRSR